jgi:superfamily II DNA or RNA helicase
MIPLVTDAALTRAISTQRMLEAGQDYWQRGRVGELHLEDGQGVVQAAVTGSARLPYQVELRFRPDAVIAICTCPVGIGCKHAAAVLLALQARQGARQPPHAVSPVREKGALAARSPTLLATDLLPTSLAQWATAMKPLVERHGATAPPASRAIIYVVRVQALVGNMRLSKKRPLASLTTPGCALRLFVEALDIGLDEDGNPVGSGARAQPAGLYGGYAPPAHVTDEDRLILQRLQMRIGDTDHEGCLTGVGGADLFERILATGRARWGTARGVSMHRQVSRKTMLDWIHDDLGRTRLSVRDVPVDSVAIVLAPPALIDAGTGAVVSLDFDMPPAMAEHLLRLPPVDAEAVATLAARWRDLVPAHVPPPLAPTVRDLGPVTPVPVLSLRMDKVTMQPWHGGHYRYSSKMQVPCALARLTFDYAGTIVDATTAEQTVLVRDANGLVRFSREADDENDAIMRLILAGLIPLFDFEEAEPAPRQEWDHAPGLPATAEDFTPFLIYDADTLRAEGWRIEVATDFPLRVISVEAADMSAAVVPSGIDWFDITLGADVDGERVDLVPALRRMLATVNADELEALGSDLAEEDDVIPVALGDGKVVAMKAVSVLPMLRALMILAANDTGPATTGSRSGFSRLDLGLLGAIEAVTPGMTWTGAEPLRRLARELTQLRLAPTPLPPDFEATLRPYQQTGFDWLEALARAGLGGLLADDMGLGKTVQTLAHIVSQKTAGALDGPVLIVAPTSVLPNWQAEIARFAPTLTVLLLHGSSRHDRHDTIRAHDIVLTSYPLLVRDKDVLTREAFGLVVFDEAHVLKNPRTAGHAAARKLTATRHIALSGTPVENQLTDVWALFEFIVPGLLGNQRDFVRMYRTPIEKHGDSEARTRLARKLKPFMLRRTKDAVAIDLPAKSVLPVMVAPGAAQMALHESQRILMQQRVRDEIARVGLMRAQIIMLTALTRLRQVCCDPRLLPGQGTKPPPSAKLERLLELLDELIAEGRRIILFSQFTSMLDLIKPELDRRHHGWVELTGKSRDRKTPVARFQQGEVPLILVSLKAGGTGLNLTTADTVILYDPWWNPAVEAQAIDRAHRIGQSKPVFVYRMIATGTIEEKILILQQRKAALADTLWSEDAASPAHLTEDDIAFLLG